MKTLALDAVPYLNHSSGSQKPAVRGLRPRLRRWFREMRQYGRFDIDLDLRGLLYLSAAGGVITPLMSLTAAPFAV
jgi:hypothetical protein